MLKEIVIMSLMLVTPHTFFFIFIYLFLKFEGEEEKEEVSATCEYMQSEPAFDGKLFIESIQFY